MVVFARTYFCELFLSWYFLTGGLIFYWVHSLSTYKFRQGNLTIAGQCNIYKKQCTIFYITYSRRYLLAYLWLINRFLLICLLFLDFVALGSKRFGCDNCVAQHTKKEQNTDKRKQTTVLCLSRHICDCSRKKKKKIHKS